MRETVAEAVIETSRLVLRGEFQGDREVWLNHINTPEAMEHLGGPKNAEQVHADFARMAQAGEFPWLLIARKSDGALLGKGGLGRIDTASAPPTLRGQVQVGWTIRADCWRQGYGSEAAGALLDLAFGRYGLAEVFAQTSERNVASARLMERLGMTRRGELDYHDPDYPPQDNPTIIYAIARDAWTPLP